MKRKTWPMIPLGQLVENFDSKRRPITKADRQVGKYPYYGATGILDFVDGYIFEEPLVLVGEDGAKWGAGEQTAFLAEGRYWVNNHAHVLRPLQEHVLPSYLIYFLNNTDLNRYVTGVTVPKLTQGKLNLIDVPLPPLSVQQEIVSILDAASDLKKKRAEADKKMAEFAPALFHQMFGDPGRNEKGWEVRKLGEIAITASGGTPDRSNANYYEGKIPWVKSGELHQQKVLITEEQITEDGLKNSSAKLQPVGTILLAMYGATVGAISELGIEAATNQAICAIHPNDDVVDKEFLLQALKILTPKLLAIRTGGAQPNLSQEKIKALDIEIPPYKLQQQFASYVIEAQKVLVRQDENGKQLEEMLEGVMTDFLT